MAVLRRINTLLRGASQKTHGGGANSHHTPSGDSSVLHVVDMFGFENCEVVCVCVCVRERERERESVYERECVCVSVCVCV